MSIQNKKRTIKTLSEDELALEREKHAVTIDILYPVGIVTFFAQSKDPNILFPDTVWKYIGENKTIRLGALDGSDILSIGGNDTITLKASQLPPHNHSFSATTDSFDYGIKSTSVAGDHKHATALSYDQSQEPIWGGYIPKGVVIRGATYKYNEKVAYTDTLGNHAHSVNIGAHHHTVSGTTSSTGYREIIDITNGYIMLMGWYRLE
ncbi:phage baseplate protein [Xenorhabdus anantnagensis]|uniref:Phage tail protein n=1 Tax=Xenorhabdus anantnagensis TaxID=3025875 RepID=A0ABT5LPQ2_9GAMM|nr:phage tail protein [Xenorhabdus anantnagensis]MDC9595731.1 phage tail protein [Xenorhabdus anantnagensis]